MGCKVDVLCRCLETAEGARVIHKYEEMMQLLDRCVWHSACCTVCRQAEMYILLNKRTERKIKQNR